MKYTIYQITNITNDKIYIGCHKTGDLNDGYMGSGLLIGRAINKYGIENFEKEYLHIFDSAEEIFDKETELVNESFVERSDTYNIKQGGYGGFDYINKNNIRASNEALRKSAKVGHKAQTWLTKNDPEWRAAANESISKGLLACGHKPPLFTGKKHTKEAKAKIGAANSISQRGKNNSMYGTCWVYNNIESKRISKDDLQQHLNDGWIKGRKMKFN
jgi:hypothetical protein